MSRVEQLRIKFDIAAYLGILFLRPYLAVKHDDHLRRDPSAFQLLILVEEHFLRVRFVLPHGLNHANEVEIFFLYPELSRSLVARFSADYKSGPALPCVFAQQREVEAEFL